MKTVRCLPYFLILFFTNCQGKQVQIKSSETDTTINKANAISDLFLDSSKVGQYISEQKLNDADGARLRTFYKNRNYQFPWFTSDGLMEQTRTFLSLHNSYIALTHDSALIDRPLHKLMDLLANDDDAIIKPLGQKPGGANALGKVKLIFSPTATIYIFTIRHQNLYLNRKNEPSVTAVFV